MENLILIGAYLTLVGIACGLLAGLFGVGGGIVMVPACFMLLRWLDLDASLAMAMSVASSLLAVVPTSVSSSLSHFRLKHVNVLILRRWWPALLLGVGLGGYLIVYFQSIGFTLFFSVLLFALALKILLFKTVDIDRHDVFVKSSASFVNFLTPFCLGFLSSIAGIGGGTLGVPTLRVLGVPTHEAIGTSAVFGFLISLPAVVIILLFSSSFEGAPPGSFGLIYGPAVLFLVPAAVMFAPLGAKLGKRCSAKALNKCFGFLLLLISARMFYAFLSVVIEGYVIAV